MGRRIVRTRGVVIRTRRLGETSKLVTLYTAECGKVKATAKGARRPRSRFGAALELFAEVQAICYLRDERELQTLGECDVTAAHPGLTPALERLAYASAACELVDRLTIEGEANGRLYQCLTGVLRGLEEVDPPQLEPLFWYFQLRVAAALGFRPELDRCVMCHRPTGGAGWRFSAPQGGAVCPECGPTDGVRLSAADLGLLAALHRLRGYQRDVIPEAPAGPGQIRAALRGFLEYHGGARGPLRALDFLNALAAGRQPASGGGQPAAGAPAPNRRVT